MKDVDQSRPGPSRVEGPTPTDEELMLAYQRGDASALEELIHRHGRPLFGFLLRLTGNRAKAEDAYQEVFLRVIRFAGSYQSSARFAAWLYTIARNLCIDQVRRDRFRAVESLDDPISEESETTRMETIKSDGPNPEENLRGQELAEALETALSGLPPEQKEVFLLRERAGLSFKEIAEMTKAPLNTVKTRMHYALNSLRKCLINDGFMGEDAG
jgi:RNA polymerase sigma-70 factor (ECF subfamily)